MPSFASVTDAARSLNSMHSLRYAGGKLLGAQPPRSGRSIDDNFKLDGVSIGAVDAQMCAFDVAPVLWTPLLFAMFMIPALPLARFPAIDIMADVGSVGLTQVTTCESRMRGCLCRLKLMRPQLLLTRHQEATPTRI
jgi:hypothetical protein